MSTASPPGPEPGFFSSLNRPAWVTVVAGLGGFLLRVRSTSYSSANGTLTSCSSVDYGPFAAAVVVLVAAIVCLRSARGVDERRGRLLRAVAVAGLILVAVHLIRGIAGAAGVSGPCS